MALDLKTKRHAAAAGALFGVAVFISYAMQNVLFGAAAFFIGGFMYMSGDAFIYQCRMMTTGFFANIGRRGHSSLIEADEFDWQPPYTGMPLYKVMCVGGSSVPILPFHGFGPVFVCPKGWVKKDIHGVVLALADWTKTDFDCLPEALQKNLIDRLEHFNPRTTPIYYADSSAYLSKNGLSAEVKINYAMRATEQEKIINDLKQEKKDMMTSMGGMANLMKTIQDIDRDRDEKPQYKLVPVKGER